MQHLASRHLCDVVAFSIACKIADFAGDDLPLRRLHKLHQRERSNGFSAAGFADDPHRGALRHVIGYAVHRLHGTDIGIKIRVQIIELNNVPAVPHLGKVFRFGHVLARLVALKLTRNLRVFLADAPFVAQRQVLGIVNTLNLLFLELV